MIEKQLIKTIRKITEAEEKAEVEVAKSPEPYKMSEGEITKHLSKAGLKKGTYKLEIDKDGVGVLEISAELSKVGPFDRTAAMEYLSNFFDVSEAHDTGEVPEGVTRIKIYPKGFFNKPYVRPEPKEIKEGARLYAGGPALKKAFKEFLAAAEYFDKVKGTGKEEEARIKQEEAAKRWMEERNKEFAEKPVKWPGTPVVREDKDNPMTAAGGLEQDKKYFGKFKPGMRVEVSGNAYFGYDRDDPNFEKYGVNKAIAGTVDIAMTKIERGNKGTIEIVGPSSCVEIKWDNGKKTWGGPYGLFRLDIVKEDVGGEEEYDGVKERATFVQYVKDDIEYFVNDFINAIKDVDLETRNRILAIQNKIERLEDRDAAKGLSKTLNYVYDWVARLRGMIEEVKLDLFKEGIMREEGNIIRKLHEEEKYMPHDTAERMLFNMGKEMEVWSGKAQNAADEIEMTAIRLKKFWASVKRIEAVADKEERMTQRLEKLKMGASSIETMLLETFEEFKKDIKPEAGESEKEKIKEGVGGWSRKLQAASDKLLATYKAWKDARGTPEEKEKWAEYLKADEYWNSVAKADAKVDAEKNYRRLDNA